MAVDAAEYAALVGDAHRKALGQFFTPPAVARFMVDWALSSGARTMHDPAFGLGAFLDAAAKHAVCCSGSEVDPAVLRYSRRATGSATIFEEDYLRSWGRRHDAIVCNPPYLRFQNFRGRKEVLAEFERRLGVRLSGYTNCASAFLVKSLAELRPGGRLAYVMPLEFLNTGYGAAIKERLAAGRPWLTLIRLGCEKEVFPDAVTSVGIILLDTARRADSAAFVSVRSLEALRPALTAEPTSRVPWGDLRPDDKWLVHFRDDALRVDGTRTCPLRRYGRFQRGIATGANAFFVLRPSEVRRLGLDRAEIAPCISKSRHLTNPVLTESDLESLVDADEPVLFFRPGPRPSPAAAAHVEDGERRRLHERFLLRHRNPWHRAETRRPAPILLGVFWRGNYKVVRNRSRALHLTCFHGFSPGLLAASLVDRIFVYLSSKTGRRLLSHHARAYGDSLTKFEPDDLNGAPAPRPEILEQIGDAETADAVERLRRGEGVPESVEDRFRAVLS